MSLNNACSEFSAVSIECSNGLLLSGMKKIKLTESEANELLKNGKVVIIRHKETIIVRLNETSPSQSK